MSQPDSRPLILVSSDAHAGADLRDYKAYLPKELHDDFEAWAAESNRLAREVVYPRLTFTENHKTARISAEYVAMANPLARQRLVLAGLRLAALLNDTLGADSPGPVPPSYPAGPAEQ